MMRAVLWNYARGNNSSRMPRRAGSLRKVRRNDVAAFECAEVSYPSTPKSTPQEGGCQSESARPETQKRTSPAEVRRLERLIVRVTDQFLIGKALAHDLRYRKIEALGIVHILAVVVPKGLL